MPLTVSVARGAEDATASAVILSFRHSLGMTQEEFAAFLQTDPRTVQRWEASTSRPPAGFVRLVLDVMTCAAWVRERVS